MPTLDIGHGQEAWSPALLGASNFVAVELLQPELRPPITSSGGLFFVRFSSSSELPELPRLLTLLDDSRHSSLGAVSFTFVISF